MKNFNKEQRKKFNKTIIITGTIMSASFVLFSMIFKRVPFSIEGVKTLAVAILGIWFFVYMLFWGAKVIIELFGGFSQETIERKIITILIFLGMVISIIIMIKTKILNR